MKCLCVHVVCKASFVPVEGEEEKRPDTGTRTMYMYILTAYVLKLPLSEPYRRSGKLLIYGILIVHIQK